MTNIIHRYRLYIFNYLQEKRGMHMSKYAYVYTSIYKHTWLQSPKILTLLMLETEYSGFESQYHSCWCTGSWSRQRISSHGIDNIG